MLLTTLTFDFPFHPGDTRAFRASIAELMGYQHEIFHHHKNGENAGHYHWDYPLVQYGMRFGKPAILGIGPGSEAIRTLLLPALPATLTFAGKTHNVENYRLQQSRYTCTLQTNPLTYGLQGWIALNKKNFHAWKKASDEGARRIILSRALTGQLRSFAAGLGVTDVKSIVGEVLRVDQQKKVAWHGTHLIRFHTLISSNINLPSGLGIGRCAAYGYGEVMLETTYKEVVGKRTRTVAV